MAKGNRNSPKNICIIDTTLREGAQASGSRFGVDESVEIARALISLGVDMIECGHPKISTMEMERVRATVISCEAVPVLAHARARCEDIDAVKSTGAQWVGIFAGINSITKEHRINLKRPIESIISEAIIYAKKIGLRVRFTIEDSSRTPRSELLAGYRLALEAGADRVCFADTVGILCPWETERIIGNLARELSGSDLEVHFHDDRGLANANALSALRRGANWVSTSVNGIGERCGISDTITLLANLDALKWRPLQDGRRLLYVSQLVQTHSRLVVDHWRPIIGKNAFTHVAKLHQRAILSDQRTYAWTPPENIGRINFTNPLCLPSNQENLISHPRTLSEGELHHYKRNLASYHLMLGDQIVSDARQYCIVRHISKIDDQEDEYHIDMHRHNVDSFLILIGYKAELKGLKIEVRLGKEIYAVESPSSVFIPSGVLHSYRALSGDGLVFDNIASGDYNSSLLDIEMSNFNNQETAE